MKVIYGMTLWMMQMYLMTDYIIPSPPKQRKHLVAPMMCMSKSDDESTVCYAKVLMILIRKIIIVTGKKLMTISCCAAFNIENYTYQSGILAMSNIMKNFQCYFDACE
jgi:hypothetical protein